MDGQSVEIVAGQLVDPAEQPSPPASTRPIPELGDVLCQVCGRHTNCEEQNDWVDIPYAFYFQKGQEPRQYKAVICFECYMNGIITGAKEGYRLAMVDKICGHGNPVEECCRRGESHCEETGLPVMDAAEVIPQAGQEAGTCGAGGAPATHCGPEGGLAEERPLP